MLKKGALSTYCKSLNCDQWHNIGMIGNVQKIPDFIEHFINIANGLTEF